MYSTSQWKKSLYEKQNRWGFFRRFNLCVWLRCVVVVFFWCYQVGPGATTNTNTILLRCGSSHLSGCYKLTAHLLLQCVCVCVRVCVWECVCEERGRKDRKETEKNTMYLPHPFTFFALHTGSQKNICWKWIFFLSRYFAFTQTMYHNLRWNIIYRNLIHIISEICVFF